MADYRALLDRPVFIISPPRSGSTLLFDALIRSSSSSYSIGRESHLLIEGIGNLAPRNRGWTSNRLTAADATTEIVEELARRFYVSLGDSAARPPSGAARMIEKTPKNSLRVPFLDAAFPDSKFVYLYRDARQTLSSMLEAWQSGRFRTYPGLPNWTGPPWSLLLVPGWEDLRRRELHEIVATQWATTVDIMIGDLEQLPAGRVTAVRYDELVASPGDVLEALCGSLGLEWRSEAIGRLPLSRTTVSPPDADKWRAQEAVIERIWPAVAAAAARAEAFERSLRGPARD